jgi:WD40 repeat protein/serine/threonine protein kinase
MHWSSQREEEIFHAALEMVSPTERAAYLHRVCNGNADFEAHLTRLLAHANAGDDLLGPDRDVEENASALAEGPGTVIDRYRLVAVLGEGAMGTVFEAEQTRPFQRRVALKVIKAGMDSREVLARFNAERQVLALLDHPNVARVLDGGTTSSGRPYFVMELVRGEPITRFCDDHRLTLEDRMALFAAVCQGVQHAHQRGIVHRDLKPGNVLVNLVDDKPVPVVIDFGVAKAIHQSLHDRTLATRPGQAVGTPSAMSPEQIAGGEAEIDTRTDVYALGALLYELLTGTVPLPKTRQPGTGWLEIERSILEDVPLRPSRRVASLDERQQEKVAVCRQLSGAQLRHALRNDLDWITLKALEKEPDRRYATVSELSADIQRHLDFLPVSVSAPSWGYLLSKFARRNRTLALATILVFLVAMTGGLVSLHKAAETRRALVRADAAVVQLEERIVVSARELLDSGRTAEGLALLADLVRQHPEDEGLSTWLANELTYRSFPQPILPPIRHPGIVYAAHFSPDGTRLLTTCIDNAARVYDSATGQLLVPRLQHDIRAVTPGEYDRGLHALHAGFNRDGTLIATASCDATARVWGVATGQPLTPPLKHPDLVSFAIFSPDEDQLVTGCCDGRVRFWTLPDGKQINREFRHDDWVNFAEFSPDGRYLVTCADDATARLWDMGTGEPVGAAIRDASDIQRAHFSPDGRRILTGGVSHRGIIWELGQILAGTTQGGIALPHSENVPFGGFSADGKWVATASFDRTARVWSAVDGRLEATLEHSGTVRMAQFSPDNLRLLTASEDGTAVLWDLQTGARVMEPLRHKGKIWSARFAPSGDKVATASADGTVVLWDIRPGDAQPLVLVNDDITVGRQDWSPDGEWVAMSGRRHGVWKVVDGRRVGDKQRWPLGDARSVKFHPHQPVLLTGNTEGFAEAWPHPDQTECVLRVFHGDGSVMTDWSPDGTRFLTTAATSLIRVWEYPGGQPAYPELESASEISTAQFTANGRWIVAGTEAGSIQVWEAVSGDVVTPWQAHDRSITSLAVTMDGLTVMSGSQDHRAAIWSLPEGRQIGDDLSHGDVVSDVALSRDGRWALTASRDGTARRWTIVDGNPAGPPLRHRGALTVIQIDEQDRHFVTGAEDGTARVWDLNTGRPITPLLRHLRRIRNAEFSPDGTRLFVASDGNPRIWSLVSPAGAAPEWLPELAETLAHSEWPGPGNDQEHSPPLASTREVLDLPDTSEWDRWHRWFHSDRISRPHAPDGELTMGQLTDRWMRDLDIVWDPIRARLLRKALEFQPRNSLGLAQLQALELASQTELPVETNDDTGQSGTELIADGLDPYLAWAEALRRIANGQRTSALTVLEPFLDCGSDHPLFWFTATQLLTEAGRIDEAKRCFTRVTDGLDQYDGGHLPGLELRWALVLWARHHAQRAFPDAAWFLHQACQIPPRSPEATMNHLDLTLHFNATLRFAWNRVANTHFSFGDLPFGFRSFAGIDFDVRGAVMLMASGNSTVRSDFHLPRIYLTGYCGLDFERQLDSQLPEQLRDLPVQSPARRIHLLMTADGQARRDEPVALLTVRLADGQAFERPIAYEADLRTWITDKHGTVTRTPPAWVGDTHTERKLRLYRITWENPHPDVPVTTIDIASAMTTTTPIILGITIEPP